MDGFFPLVDLDEKPDKQESGFREFGLPYAADAAVTRYLAAFLTAHRHAGDDTNEQPNDSGTGPARPDIVLFNGGLFASQQIRRRLLDVIGNWFGDKNKEKPWQPIVLANDRLDLAVARGAAYYGMVRRGQGVRIAAGLARTYYIGVAGEGDTAAVEPVGSESPEPAPETPGGVAVCLAPAGLEPGQDLDLTERVFDLLVSRPVEFPLYVSSTRLTDKPGELVAVDREQMRPLPPIRTVLHSRKKGDSRRISVYLHARLTEIGTLDLWCTQVDGRGSWRLQFDVRSATQTDVAAHETLGERGGFVEEATWDKLQGLFRHEA